MQLMCERMVQQQLYACAAVLTSPVSSTSGDYANLSVHTSFRQLLTRLAAHLASEAEAARFDDLLQEDPAPYASDSVWDDNGFESDEEPS